MQRIHSIQTQRSSVFNPSRKRAIRVILLTLLVSSIHIPTVNATSPFRWDNRRENEGGFRLIPELSFYSTTSNFNYDGRKQKVSSLNSYKKRVLDVYGIYGFNKRWTGYLRLSHAAVSFDTTANTSSRSALTEQAIGANYRLLESEVTQNRDGGFRRATTVDLQFEASLPIYDNVSDRSKGLALMGDGSMDLSIGPFLSLPLGQTGNRKYMLMGAGLTFRSQSYSKAIPYQLSYVSIPEQSGLLFRIGFHGFMSMSSDDASVTTSSGTASTDAGGSLAVDALNSSYMNGKILLGYQTNGGAQYYLNYQLALSGKSTAAFDGFTVGAMWRWAGSGKTQEKATLRDPRAKKTATYILDARVKKSNDKLNLVQIDQGDEVEVAVGDVFDFYKVGPDGKPREVIARGIVTSVKPTEAIVNVRQYFKQIWIEPGMIGRKLQK